jgi:hypothetical protein
MQKIKMIQKPFHFLKQMLVSSLSS